MRAMLGGDGSGSSGQCASAEPLIERREMEGMDAEAHQATADRAGLASDVQPAAPFACPRNTAALCR